MYLDTYCCDMHIIVITLIEEGSMSFTVDSGSSLLQTCGICGTQNGQVIDLNGFVATTPAEHLKVAESYRTPARYQSLRVIRKECSKW